MSDASPFLERNFCCRDFNAVVDLYGVAIDDFAIELESDFNPERTFSGSRRTDDGNNWIEWLVSAHARENSMRKRITPQTSAREKDICLHRERGRLARK